MSVSVRMGVRVRVRVRVRVKEMIATVKQVRVRGVKIRQG